MAVKKLLPTYLEAIKTEVDSAIVADLTPTSVHVLTTACNSVYSHYLSLLSRDVRKRGLKKNSLTALIRLLVEAGINEEMSIMAEIYCERYSESDGAIPLEKIRTLVGRLVEAKKAKDRVALNPRYDYRTSAYRKDLTTGLDVEIRKGDEVELISILKSKSYSANSAPAIDPRALLLKILIFFNSEPFIKKVQYKLLCAGSKAAPDPVFELSRDQLKENPDITIQRIISWYGLDRKEKGKHCGDCVHSGYCMVLKDELKQEAERAKAAEEEI